MTRILARYKNGGSPPEKVKMFSDYARALRRSGILFLFKDKSPFHNLESQTKSEVVTCSCHSSSKGVEYWMKSDQSIFCAKCGQLQDPSFWVQPLTLSQIDEGKMLNVPAEKDDHAKMEKWKKDFLNTMAQYQGKSCVINIPVKVYDRLVTYFKEKDLIVQGTHPSQRFANVTPTHIRQGLYHLKLLKHYDAAHFIHQKLTGKVYINLDILEKNLFEDFMAVAHVFVKTILCKTFLQPLYLLQHLLRRRDALRIQVHVAGLKTTTKLNQQDLMCSQLFTTLGWPFRALPLAMCDDLHNMALREEPL